MLRLWQPYLWAGQMFRLLYALPQICDLVYLVSVVSQWPIDMPQNVRDQESQVSMAWPRVVGTLSKDDDDGSENVSKK